MKICDSVYVFLHLIDPLQFFVFTFLSCMMVITVCAFSLYAIVNLKVPQSPLRCDIKFIVGLWNKINPILGLLLLLSSVCLAS